MDRTRDLETGVASGTPLCRRLRWRGRLLDAEPDPWVGDPSADFVWCTHTMNCLGPDGKVAGRRRCGPDRPCFER